MKDEFREFREDEVTFSIVVHDEDMPIEGNFASGDKEADRETVQAIKADLKRGNRWAWCAVEVIASRDSYQGGSDYLGGCSYSDVEEFMADPYYADMKERALAELNAKAKEDHRRREELEPLNRQAKKECELEYARQARRTEVRSYPASSEQLALWIALDTRFIEISACTETERAALLERIRNNALLIVVQERGKT